MDSELGSRTTAHAGVLDVLRLGVKLGAGKLRGKRGDLASAGTHWARDVIDRDHAADLAVGVPGKTLEVVGDRDVSNSVLESRPVADGYEAGEMKTKAMSFLAPGALTIANGDAWMRLRPFNEKVLGTGAPHQFSQAILDHVRSAFASPVHRIEDVRSAMGQAMVDIVLGGVPNGANPAMDVATLFDVVQSPVKRALLGFLYKGKRDRLYSLLSSKWDAALTEKDPEPNLVSLAAHSAPDVDRSTLLQQVPHWMFTFTGSGTDLLTRTIVLVSSRPDALEKLIDEVRSAGDLSKADSVGRLKYLEACVLETGRLFPPVTKTFHRRASEHREIVHYFPLLQRDDRLGPTVHTFHPERWLMSHLDAPAAASNLFLRGPRACPGMDLILFVCKAAAARQLGELGLIARQELLTRDPLPVSFPKLEEPFSASRRH
jgi:cytochrome P450